MKMASVFALAFAACLSFQTVRAEETTPVKNPDGTKINDRDRVVNPNDGTTIVKPDNTKINERDRVRNEANPTADQQGQGKTDVEIAAKIRREVVKDDTLSTSAHNIKIISINGLVTLRGPVKNEAEKASIEKKAMDVAGEKSVKSEIEITNKP